MAWWQPIAALVGLYALTELVARWWLRHRNHYYVWLPGVRLHLYTDRAAVPEFEPLLRIEVNRDGERGPDVLGGDEGLYRVLVAGGSAVEGHSLDQASNWPSLVALMLNAPDSLAQLHATRVHVGGVGRSAVTAQDVDLILQRVLPRYRHLDAVAVMIGAGDVVKWLARGAPADAPAPPGTVADLFACHPEGPFGWRPDRTAAAQLVNRLRRRYLRPIKVAHGAGTWIAQARAMRAAASELRTAAGDPTVMLDTFARYLRRSLQRAATHASRALLLRTPWFEKDYTAEEAAHLWHGALGHPWRRQRISTYYAFDVVNRLMGMVDARSVQVAGELGVELVDLKSCLTPSLDLYYDYTHFTPAGARIVAQAVAAALLGGRPREAARRSDQRTTVNTLLSEPARPPLSTTVTRIV